MTQRSRHPPPPAPLRGILHPILHTATVPWLVCWYLGRGEASTPSGRCAVGFWVAGSGPGQSVLEEPRVGAWHRTHPATRASLQHRPFPGSHLPASPKSRRPTGLRLHCPRAPKVPSHQPLNLKPPQHRHRHLHPSRPDSPAQTWCRPHPPSICIPSPRDGWPIPRARGGPLQVAGYRRNWGLGWGTRSR